MLSETKKGASILIRNAQRKTTTAPTYLLHLLRELRSRASVESVNVVRAEQGDGHDKDVHGDQGEGNDPGRVQEVGLEGEERHFAGWTERLGEAVEIELGIVGDATVTATLKLWSEGEGGARLVSAGTKNLETAPPPKKKGGGTYAVFHDQSGRTIE